MKELIFSLGMILVTLPGCTSAPAKRTDRIPVKGFELERYLGTWYEIARFPHSFEKNLVGVTATYNLRPDGKIEVINKGYKNTLEGELSSITGKAKPAADPATGHLKVSFFLFFYADYKILELDSLNYSYALVGGSGDNYLWILSREPEMPESIYQFLVDKALSLGYDISKLQLVAQKPKPL